MNLLYEDSDINFIIHSKLMGLTLNVLLKLQL